MRQIPNFLNNKYLDKRKPTHRALSAVETQPKNTFRLRSMYNIRFYSERQNKKIGNTNPPKHLFPTKIPTFARRKQHFLCRNTTKQS